MYFNLIYAGIMNELVEN